MMVWILILLCGICHALTGTENKKDTKCHCNEDVDCQHPTISWYPNFSNNPLISHKMQRCMGAYLLPLQHSIKSILDSIFSSPGIIANQQTLRNAGFLILFFQKASQIIVARHPSVKGYLFKIYLDDLQVCKDDRRGWELLTARCITARKIREIIDFKHIKHFTVADKWLYPLPIESNSWHHEPVVLIVKDMNIYNSTISKKAWRTKVNKKHLKELYAILKNGFGSSCLPRNVPYTKQGKFAFIDTEGNKKKIMFNHVLHHLSKKMCSYWKKMSG